jgi:hypothetical protein
MEFTQSEWLKEKTALENEVIAMLLVLLYTLSIINLII